jgi:hypothetical protein
VKKVGFTNFFLLQLVAVALRRPEDNDTQEQAHL